MPLENGFALVIADGGVVGPNPEVFVPAAGDHFFVAGTPVHRFDLGE